MIGRSVSVQETVCDMKKLGYIFKKCVCVHAHTCIGATEYVWRTELVLSIYWMGSRLDLGLSGLTINIPLAESPGWPHLKTKLHVFFNL